MSHLSRSDPDLPGYPPTFSLTVGGPWYRFCLKVSLARPPLRLLPRRLLFVVLVCWPPLLCLTALAGRLTSNAAEPFLLDPEVQARLLLALPLLIASEVWVHVRLSWIVGQFTARGIIAPPDRLRYDRILAAAARLRDSWLVELVLFLLALTLGHWLWRQWLTFPISSWYATVSGSAQHLSAAGVYYAFVSLAVLRFELYRWYFRLFVWYRLLWQIKSLPLRLNLYHPDRLGGLGFLANSLPAFAPVFAAQSIAIAAYIYARILYADQRLPAYTTDIAIVLLLFALLTVCPLGFFVHHLERAGRKARFEFGALASHYVDDFRRKWVEPGSPSDGLLGTPDLQSLADLANTYSVISLMRVVPVTPYALSTLAWAIAIPFLPLVLTMIPMHEVLQRFVKMVF